MLKARKEDFSLGCCLYRVHDELNIQYYKFETGVGLQDPKERSEMEWSCVPEEYQFFEGRDIE